MMSQVVGNGIAAIILNNDGKLSVIFIIFSCLAIIGSLMFCVLRVPKKKVDELLSQTREGDKEEEAANPI